MAELLKVTARGTYNGIQWAVNLWVRKVSPSLIISEANQAEALAGAAAVSWLDNVNPVLSTAVASNKFIAEGYDTPAAYFELNTDMVGSLAGEVTPQFNAQGYRQHRTNSDFRAATHRVPSVREADNSGGVWIYGGGITSEMTAAAASYFANELSFAVDSITYVFQPVLIRTQYTPRGVEDPVTTIFDPPQVSDVPSASFYGITSQVSRKLINHG